MDAIALPSPSGRSGPRRVRDSSPSPSGEGGVLRVLQTYQRDVETLPVQKKPYWEASYGRILRALCVCALILTAYVWTADDLSPPADFEAGTGGAPNSTQPHGQRQKPQQGDSSGDVPVERVKK